MEEKIDANYKNLERVNNWISNSDTKAGMILTFNGILCTYLITKTPLVKEIILRRGFDLPSFFLYLTFCAYALLLGVSLYHAFRVISPDIKERISSLFYFGTIAGMELKDFKKRMKELSQEDIEEELINQTYVNAKITITKFTNLKSSIRYLFLSLAFWALSLVFVFLL